MTRLFALLLAAFASVPVTAPAQTPRHIAASNELRICLWEQGGLRSLAQAWELSRGIDYFRGERIWAVSETGAGLYRVTRSKPSGLIAEIRLPDASGNATCLLFGPALQPGDAALAADHFVSTRYPEGFRPAEPTPGLERRYVAVGLPYQLELVAYRAEGFGDIVGMVLTGASSLPTARQLTAGQPDVSRETVRAYAAWALEICARNIGNDEWIRAAIEKGGFVLDPAAVVGSSMTKYFLPDNSMSASVGAFLCDIETRYMGAAETVQLTRDTLNRAFPGVYREDQASNGDCRAFHSTAGGNMPINIYVGNIGQGAQRVCAEDGTSRIKFEIPG
ncbi:MAG: hypothetical protein KDK24_19795 [Pseudooceanicola sp.]|nr:hypothetical protein [Pseudooceanicola sp.]